MKRFTTHVIEILSAILTITSISIISCNTDVESLTIRVKSRMYPEFHEEHNVKMYQKFPISDSDLEGVVVEFLPDFAIDTLSHRAFSRSDTLNNPAAKVLVIKGREKKEEMWAFPPGMLPHFSPKSFIGFELVDFKTSHHYKQQADKNSGQGKIGE